MGVYWFVCSYDRCLHSHSINAITSAHAEEEHCSPLILWRWLLWSAGLLRNNRHAHRPREADRKFHGHRAGHRVLLRHRHDAVRAPCVCVAERCHCDRGLRVMAAAQRGLVVTGTRYGCLPHAISPQPLLLPPLTLSRLTLSPKRYVNLTRNHLYPLYHLRQCSLAHVSVACLNKAVRLKSALSFRQLFKRFPRKSLRNVALTLQVVFCCALSRAVET